MRKPLTSWGLSLALMGLLSLAPAVWASTPIKSMKPTVVTSDWTIVETMMALNHPPVGVGDKRAYERWVSEPALPVESADIGLRAQPNIELIQALKPDLMINGAWLQQHLPGYASLGRKEVVDFFTDHGSNWGHTTAATRQLGALLQKQAAAEALIKAATVQFQQQGIQLQPWRTRPIAVVQFIDARHLRIYAQNSLYGNTLAALALPNAWKEQGNAWGFATIDLTQLAKLPPQTMLIIVAPYPPSVAKQLQKNQLWQRLPYARPQNVLTLPPVWSFGGIPSMRRFANILAAGLQQKGQPL